MEILTIHEKKELKVRARRERCVGIIKRLEELKDQGYGAYDSKLIAAQELNLTVQYLYKEIRWYNKNNDN